MKLAGSMARLEIESAFEVLARAKALEREGRDIIHLELGEPDFPTPPHIVEAGKRALDEGWTKYGSPMGLPAFRESLAAYVSRTRGVKVGPETICVTPGAKPILFLVMMALLEPGDEVIYPDPGFPIYSSMTKYLGATPVPVPVGDLDQFRDRLSPKTKLVILNSPHNPTGSVIAANDMAEIAGMLRDRDVMVLSDEIYGRICFEIEPVSIASFDGMLEKTVIMDGFSKTYAMTGWRLGYASMPEWLAQAVEALIINSNSCTASFVQRAGIAALEGPQDCVAAMVAEFRARRDVMIEGLNRIPGFRCAVPAGAFYAFPNVEGTGITSKEVADRILNDAGVACIDGASFGAHGAGHVRFSCANSVANIMEAIRRIPLIF
jgi:aspartate aminotransferase